MIYLLALLNGCLWAWLRRVYGGMMEGTWLGNRGIQTAFMIIAMLPLFFYNYGYEWFYVVLNIGAVAWLQFQFWSRGHYPLFAWEKGNDNPTQEEIDRYNSRWYNKFCLWMVNYKATHTEWYNKLYTWIFPSVAYSRHFDFIYILLRYTCPMIPMMFFDWRYILIGLLVAPVYLLCDWLNTKKIGLFGQFDSQLAEWIVGFIFGFGLVLING